MRAAEHVFALCNGSWTSFLPHYPATYSTPLSEPRYTAAALPPTTWRQAWIQPTLRRDIVSWSDVVLRYCVDGLHAAGVLLATRFNRPLTTQPGGRGVVTAQTISTRGLCTPGPRRPRP